ncbi:MAG: SWIM zinc finger family protein, partial [Gemmatimonadetes bacterium]|nr:SWIM zinc finger family protein [Gemmatimonadota bacterium]
MSEWWGFDGAPRREAKDGIAARSRRGEIGETWWSKRFIAALNAVADTSRLSRGRSYARSGQVMGLGVEPGEVTAKVQGSRPSPYRVRIGLTPFTEEEWERAERALAGQALFLAALLAGEMPRDVEEAFEAAGLSLFPARPDELKTDCSCPDWANPCKHVAATFYILAEAFDEDPFLVLAWRGRPKERLLERLRELRGAAEPPAQEPGDAPEEPRTGGFWRAGPELAGLAFSPRAAEVPDAVLRQLGSLPPEAGG